ncbi:uncharacterized protein HD556DRAFT_1449037 [Suillus plorans]|uniref:Uncharacterized protein n=1 Tax=Suillus plorans TaxID=116603 RepID=A0A9P7DBY1_9AGAM|nr:uncharacterized protein HD556DRAFT_1449037 [Suillus plorans]KAG1787114.1 hypothetical protein HD556DRAFT_1449037 [Suillus plorans]
MGMGKGTGAVKGNPHPYPRCTLTRDPCGLPIPVQLPNNDMLVDAPFDGIGPGNYADAPRPTRSGRGHPGRYHRGRGGRVRPPQQREHDSDALGAFTRFFRAEAQASKRPFGVNLDHLADLRRHPLEELATRKESHAFDELVRAERAQRAYERYSPRTRNLSLDHRRGPRARSPPEEPPRRVRRAHSPPRHRVSRASSVPSNRSALTPAAQLIADVTSNASIILAPTPAPKPPAVDPGRDVEDIIAAAEQLDLEQAGHMPGVTTEDVLGRIIPLRSPPWDLPREPKELASPEERSSRLEDLEGSLTFLPFSI